MRTRMHYYRCRLAIALVAPALHAPLAAASEFEPLKAHLLEMGAVQGVAYYTEEADGLRLVATVSAGEASFRVVSTLSANRIVTLAVPRTVDQTAKTLEFRRVGDSLHVSTAKKVVGNRGGLSRPVQPVVMVE